MQVVYNIFDQNPEDELFPDCEQPGIAVIARVPFDEGSLTGTLTPQSTLARGRLAQPVFHARESRDTLDARRGAEAARPAGMTLPELALRFILQHPAVTTAIPGMRKLANVRANCAASDGQRLPQTLIDALRAHRWERDWVVA